MFSATNKAKCATRAGPSLNETLRLLAPLAPKLEKLYLSGNKLGGTITDGIAAFTKLTDLRLIGMGLEGELLCVGPVPTQSREKSEERSLRNKPHTRNVPRAFLQAPSRRRSEG